MPIVCAPAFKENGEEKKYPEQDRRARVPGLVAESVPLCTWGGLWQW